MDFSSSSSLRQRLSDQKSHRCFRRRFLLDTPAFFLLLVSFALPVFAETRADKTLARAKANPGAKWWQVMDTGPFLSDTFRLYGGEVCALKGVALEVGPNEDHTLLFDTETLRMVAGFRGDVALAGTPWNGGHNVNCSTPKDQADYFFTSNWGPGWAIDGEWTDLRKKDNGRANGPLPDDLAKFRGIYRHEGGSVLSYTVGH